MNSNHLYIFVLQLCIEFYKYKESYFENSNPMEENTISKLEQQADFSESYISFMKYICGN